MNVSFVLNSYGILIINTERHLFTKYRADFSPVRIAV